MRHRIGYKTGLVAIEFNPNIHAEHNAKVILSQLQVVLYSNAILPTNVNTLFRGEVQVANIAHINTEYLNAFFTKTNHLITQLL